MPRYEDNIRGGGGHSPNDRRDRRSLKSPLIDRHRRDSPPQYQSSSSRLGPRDHDRHSASASGGGSGGGLYHHRDPYSSSRSSHHYSRELTSTGSMPYKILCLSNLNSKFPDSTIRNEIEKEFSRFGEPMVKLVYDRTERIAYLYFQCYDDARDARRASSRITILDRQLIVEPIYNPVRKRSASPEYHRSLLRSHSPRRITPTHRTVNDRYQLSHPRDYHREVHNPHSKSDNFSTPLSSRPQPGPNPTLVRESKKDKFPNYLHHIPPEDDDKSTRTLFVGNLEVNITEPDLKRIFERYGDVDDIDVKRPPPGQGNAYAFIKFVNLDMAHRAKVEMSGQYIGKFQCKIGYGKATPTTRIWVGGLGSWTNLTLLDKEFDRFGAIRKIDYNKGDNFAYIQYDSLDAAQAACQAMRGYPLGGNDKRLRVDYADPTSTSLSPRPGNDGNASFTFNNSPRNTQNNNNNNGNNNNEFWSGDNYHPTSPKRKRIQNSDGELSDRKRSPISGLSSPRHENADSAENGSPSFDLSNGKSQIKASFNESVTSVAELVRCSAPAWTGGLVIKSSAFASKACFCCGDFLLVNELMKSDNSTTSNVVLRLTQRLRMDPDRLDDVSQRINSSDSANKYCMMVVSQANISLSFENYTPGSDGVEAAALQTRPIRNLVTYLKSKDAAGVVLLTDNPAVSTDELSDAKGVLYIFPPHKFSVDLLRKVAPNLAQDSTDKEDFLVFVLFRGPH